MTAGQNCTKNAIKTNIKSLYLSQKYMIKCAYKNTGYLQRKS